MNDSYLTVYVWPVGNGEQELPEDFFEKFQKVCRDNGIEYELV
jgi:hypothetical protein